MAMKTCSECGEQISSSARTCPKCGKRQTSLVTKIFTGFFIFIGAGIVLVNITTPDKPSAAPVVSKDPYSAARGACRIALMRTLNDPDSAQLDPGREWAAETLKDGSLRVQPTGRAKNAFGAYIRGTWDCVARPEGENIRIISLKQIRP